MATNEDILAQVEQMTVAELNELVSAFEEKFGVSAAAMVAAGGGGGGGADEDGGGKSSYDVNLTSAGDQKIQVIKAVKELLGVGLKEAKELVDGAPSTVKAGVPAEEAEEMKKAIEAAGGVVELK